MLSGFTLSSWEEFVEDALRVDLQGSRGVASVAVHVGSKATCLNHFLRTVIYYFKLKAPT
jgi:hypothetical protein